MPIQIEIFRAWGSFDVGAGVRLVPGRWKEPRFDETPIAHSLDPSAALGEPDVPQAAPEEAPLPFVWRMHAEGRRGDGRRRGR